MGSETDEIAPIGRHAHLANHGRPPASGARWSQRKAEFVEHILRGEDGASAARLAGYSERTARGQAWKLLHSDPLVMAELERRREAMRQETAITVETMVEQLDEDRAFAIKTENATAAVRASELKAKLAGLLVERRDVRAVGGFMVRIEGIDYA